MGAQMMVAEQMPGSNELNLLIGRIAAELATVAETMRDLQDALGSLVAGSEVDPKAIVQMQSLDAAEQTVTNLSEFLTGLGPCIHDADDETLSQLFGRIRLSALAGRLRADSQQDLDELSGDMELF